MTTKLEQLLGWMDSAEYAPTYGELHEKVKELITEEQKKILLDMMEADEELGLYEKPNKLPNKLPNK